MKVVIFAGGLGTRLAEETDARPKPMVEIGGKPILWHVMKIYESQGFNDFIICLGYKGNMIRDYFMNYYIHNSDVTLDLRNNHIDVHQANAEKFKITLVDTGLNTKTAGRLLRVKDYVGKDTFMLTYGDGVADIDLKKLVRHHRSHGKLATLTAIQPNSRYGSISIDKRNLVTNFIEKPKDTWVNGGFFVLEPEIFKIIDKENADNTMWEDYPLEILSKRRQLVSYKHTGFWKAMDALRDKLELEKLWIENKAKWCVWK